MKTCDTRYQSSVQYVFPALFQIPQTIYRTKQCRSDRSFTYIVTSENANDFAVAVKLAEDPLLHVLIARQQSALSYQPEIMESRHTFFNSG